MDQATTASGTDLESTSKKRIHDEASPSTSASAPASEQPTEVIVNYWPQSRTQRCLQNLFSSVGPLQRCRLIYSRYGNHKGYAFVTYKFLQDAKTAMDTLNGLRIDNKTIKVSFSRPEIFGGNLHIAGIPPSMSKFDLDKLFAPYGEIISSRILRNRVTGLPTGKAFVRFSSKEQAESAIQHVKDIMPNGLTKPLFIAFAKTPGTNTPGAKTPGAKTPGAKTPGAKTPGAKIPGACRKTLAARCV